MDKIYLKHDNDIYQYNGSESDLKQAIILALNNKNDSAVRQRLTIDKRCGLLDVIFNGYIAKNLTLNEKNQPKQILFFEGIVMIEFDKLNFEFIDFNEELYKINNLNDKNEIISYSKSLIDLINNSKLISIKSTSSMALSDIINTLEKINQNMELEDIKTKLESINKSISHPKEVFDITFDLQDELKCDDKNK